MLEEEKVSPVFFPRWPVAPMAVLFAMTTSAATQTVVMKSISYEPKRLEIHVNDSVVWSNKSHTEHSATADDPKDLDTGMVAPQKSSKEIRFVKPGTYAYHCSMHGKSMSGEIIVKP